MDFYTLDQLNMEGPGLDSIREIEVIQEPEEHGRLTITAEVSETKEEQLMYGLKSQEAGALYGAGKLLFSGILSETKFYKKNDVRYAKLTYLTRTCQMDF